MVATKAANHGQARLGAVEGDCPERREQRPQDHRARLVEAAEHDHPERGRDENQKQLRRAQESEVSRPREDDEADRRSDDVAPRRERDRVLTDDPVEAAPDEAGRQDDERDSDEQSLAEALVGRVGRIGPDPERAFSKLASRPALMTGERSDRATSDVCRTPGAVNDYGDGQPPSLSDSRCGGGRRLGRAGAAGPTRPRLRLLRRRSARQGRDARAALASDGLAIHAVNGALFGLAFHEARARLPVGPRKLAFGMAIAEHLALYPLCYLVDRYHPARGEPGVPPLLTNRRAFAQATWRHALFGAVLGRLAPESGASWRPTRSGHPESACCVGSRSPSPLAARIAVAGLAAATRSPRAPRRRLTSSRAVLAELPERPLLRDRVQLQPSQQRRSGRVPGSARALAQPHVHREPVRRRRDDVRLAHRRQEQLRFRERLVRVLDADPFVGQNDVMPLTAIVYYVNRSRERISAPPKGLMMIAGNAEARSRQPKGIVAWSCGAVGGPPRYATIPACREDQMLQLQATFPNCWDGRRLDSADHKQHLKYSRAVCAPRRIRSRCRRSSSSSSTRPCRSARRSRRVASARTPTS